MLRNDSSWHFMRRKLYRHPLRQRQSPREGAFAFVERNTDAYAWDKRSPQDADEHILVVKRAQKKSGPKAAFFASIRYQGTSGPSCCAKG